MKPQWDVVIAGLYMMSLAARRLRATWRRQDAIERSCQNTPQL